MRLADTGTVFVTESAARTYATQARLQPEEARRELTVLLLGAKQGDRGRCSAPELWRFRSLSKGVDISARVIRDGELAVVVNISARSY